MVVIGGGECGTRAALLDGTARATSGKAVAVVMR
jgi:hypothetical protein